MFDEDGYLDPFLKALVVGLVSLGLARMLWGWITDDFTDWITDGMWGWVTGHLWWVGVSLGLGLLGMLFLVRVFMGPLPDDRTASSPYQPIPAEAENTEVVTLTFGMRQLAAMTPQGFEQACADLLARDGFLRPRRVGGSGDLGLDVQAWDASGLKVVMQCKRYERPVGAEHVQRFNGTARPEHDGDVAVMVGLNGFTEPATVFARRHGITLLTRDELRSWAHGAHLYSVIGTPTRARDHPLRGTGAHGGRPAHRTPTPPSS